MTAPTDTPAPPDAAPVAAPAPAPSPRPRAPLALNVLATLAVLFALWATQDLLLPILLAMFFALVGNPILRMLQRLRIPRPIGAVAVLSGGLAVAVLLGNLMAEPAAELIHQLPRQMREVAPKLREAIRPVREAKKGAESIARAAGGEDATAATKVIRTETSDPYRALTATPRMLASVLAVVLLTLFFMIYGGRLQRHALALLPDETRRQATVELLQSIERELSRYVLTISLINAALGMLFAGALALLGVALPEALMWGALAMLLNFVPFVGPLLGAVAMLVLGVVHFDITPAAFAPAGLYLALHALESQLVTPIVLGRRMALSPLVLILGLMVFGWLWGAIGLLLAVPLLVCAKLVLERVDPSGGWARLLE